MFINCPHCSALVATEPATDLPPPRCPRCASVLRETHAEPDAATTRSQVAVDASPEDAVAAPEPESEALSAADAHHASRDDLANMQDTGSEVATPTADENIAIPAVQAEPAIAAGAPATTPEVATSAPQIERAPSIASGIDRAPPVETSVECASPAPAAATGPVIDEAGNASIGNDHADAPADAGADRILPAAIPVVDESPSTTPPAAIAPSRRDKPAPSFARTRAPAVTANNARRRWALPSLIAGLSLLLALQWILADRARLAADAGWRPFVAQLCATLRCALPPWREPSAFALLERDVRPHPDVPGALRVTATFRNDARWPQPWPEVVLTLSDVDGRAVGVRAFVAADYLGKAPTQNALSSGQTATIRMDIVEPAPRSVAFAFDFR